jgi:hypothetical protein
MAAIIWKNMARAGKANLLGLKLLMEKLFRFLRKRRKLFVNAAKKLMETN